MLSMRISGSLLALGEESFTTGRQMLFGIDDQSKYLLSASITEWWLVAGVLTENEGSEVTMTGRIVINGYWCYSN